MKFSYKLLKQFAPIKLSSEQLARAVTEHVFEMQLKPAPIENGFDGIFTAKVLEIKKHPNADRLRLVKLQLADKIIEPVVCGASNFQNGDIVALALPGAKISQNIHSAAHESFILEKAKIRGVESQGMICAEFELGMTKQPDSGILVFEKMTPIGLPLNEIFRQAKDDVLEAALPANRPDLHSHLGMAREISAILNLKTSKIKLPQKKISPSKNWKVEVRAPEFCRRYYAVRLSGIQIRPAPEFIQEALRAVGMRPINNIVDITNYIMVELGQPTHAFDAAKVVGNIIVRAAKKDEKFLALNHKEYSLTGQMFVIADEKKAIALGGIIGGLETEINNSTTAIILEVANFDPVITRKTSKATGLKTEGSLIWEKNVHPELSPLALARSLELLEKYAGAKIEEFVEYEKPIKQGKPVKFKTGDLNKLLGTDFSSPKIIQYLSRYSIKSKVENRKSKIIASLPPWWRTDLESMPDLAEEVLKLAGYNNSGQKPLEIFSPILREQATKSDATEELNFTKNIWCRLGYAETRNYNFVSEKEILKFGGSTEAHLAIANPLSAEQKYLRKYPLISLLKNVCLNQKHFENFKLFETAKQYFEFENEPLVLLALIFSKHAPVEKLIMDIKGDVLEFLKTLGLGQINFDPDAKAPWVDIKSRGTNIGGFGFINRQLAKNFDIDGNAAFAKLELKNLFEQKQDVACRAISKFPAVKRDISIVIDKKIMWSDLESLIRPTSNLIKNIELFESAFLAVEISSLEYHKNLEKQGLKNYGIRLILEAFDHTLTDSEVAGIMGRIVVKLKSEIKAEIR